MPVIKDSDTLAIFGRYLIYAREPFTFPIGMVRSLGFPFENTNISKASIPLFAIPLKFLSGFYEPIGDFYFPVLFEFVSVFLTGYVTCLLLMKLGIKSFWLKLLGAVLVTLSFPLLHRSSEYYNMSFAVGYFPIYALYFYLYINARQNQDLKSLAFLALLFPIAALIDYYLLLGIVIMLCASLCIDALEYLLNRNRESLSRFRKMLLTMFAAGLVTMAALYALDDQGNLTAKTTVTPMTGRFSTAWGYGGGFGGGFHVADVLAVFIPPDGSSTVPNFKRCGPSGYPAMLGFPLTTAVLQNGQYEGFSYIGTVTIFLLAFVTFVNFGYLRKRCIEIMISLKSISGTRIKDLMRFFSPTFHIGFSAFCAYIISWGYLIHLAGIRLNYIPTPSLIMAEIWPQFMYARSLGRLSIPFVIFLIVWIVVQFGKSISKWVDQSYGKKALSLIIICIIAIHIYEIRGYFIPPDVTYGNDVTNVFGAEDRDEIKRQLKGRKAIMAAAPLYTGKLQWAKICYSLTYFSGIPISGATAALGTFTEQQMNQYNKDMESILSGNVEELVRRYGNIAIAAPSKIGKSILEKADIPLKYEKLKDQDLMILIPSAA